MPTSTSPPDRLQERFARRVASHIDGSTEALPHDIVQRLRFGREQALRAARVSIAQQAQVVSVRSGSVALAGPHWPWRLASLLPLVVLVAGLYLIGQVHRSQQIHAAAEVDAVLLADELPPAAYTDPGFAEFLKRPLP